MAPPAFGCLAPLDLDEAIQRHQACERNSSAESTPEHGLENGQDVHDENLTLPALAGSGKPPPREEVIRGSSGNKKSDNSEREKLVEEGVGAY